MVGRRDSGNCTGSMENITKEIGNRVICMVQAHIKIRMESKPENGLKENYNDLYNNCSRIVI